MNDEPLIPQYIGDGIYVQEGRFPGEVVMTLGTHKIEEAETVIYIDPSYIPTLVHFMQSVQLHNRGK